MEIMLLETVYNEKINFFQPIATIEAVENRGYLYGNYDKALAIQFVGVDKIYHIIDNEETRKTLSDNGYSLT